MSKEFYELESSSQCAFLPIKDKTIYNFRNKLKNSYWIPEEALTNENKLKDRTDWKTASEDIKRFVKYILAFFAIGDAAVIDLIGDITARVKHSDWINFEAMKAANESVHSETYARLIEIYIDDPKERTKLFNATAEYDVAHGKIKWVKKWFSPQQPLCYLLYAMIILESVYFSGAFEAIFWLRRKGLFPALSLANEWIARDEGIHGDCYIYIYKTLEKKIPATQIIEITREAVNVAINFINAKLPRGLNGINKKMMADHIKSKADDVLTELNYQPIWNIKNPFDSRFTNAISRNADFFLTKPTDYNKHVEEETDADFSDIFN